MAEPTVLFEVGDGVATLTLNRPDKLNAFNDDMHREMTAAFDRIEAEPAIRAVLLTGAGRAFCSGQDLGARAIEPGAPPVDLGDTLEQGYHQWLRRLVALERPVVAAVNGIAAGAGANLALACDIVLAGRSASFIEAFSRIGLIPDCGGTWHLPRLVGQARAMGMALTGEAIGAEQAEAWGLIWRVVGDDELMDEARALAGRLAAGPTLGLGLTKRALRQSFANDFEQQIRLERELQRKAGFSDDFKEGVKAFLEKRPARFSGR